MSFKKVVEVEEKIEELDDFKKLNKAFETAKGIITKDYLYHLDDYKVLELPTELQDLEIDSYARIYKFTRIVMGKNESILDRIVTILNTAYSTNGTVVTIISGKNYCVEYYVGIVCKDIEEASDSITMQGEAFSGAFNGNFQGVLMEPIQGDEKKNLLKNIFKENHIAAISGIASIRAERDTSYRKFVQGIEHLVDSLQGKVYNIVIIADPINACELDATKQGYEMLSTQLSPFLKTSISYNSTESFTLTQSHANGITKSLGDSVAITQNYSQAKGWSKSTSQGKSSSKDMGQMTIRLMEAGLNASAIMGAGGIETCGLLAAASSVGTGLIGTFGQDSSKTVSENGNTTENLGTIKTQNLTIGSQNSNTISKAEDRAHGKTVQYSIENKMVKDLLVKIDKHIERLQKCESYGAFNCATYVISSNPETTAIVASAYNALMRGAASSFQASHINTWDARKQKGGLVKEYLMKLSHPLFKNTDIDGILYSVSSIINSYELAINIAMPQKSVSGLPVFNMEEFGRNVIELNGKLELPSIEIGNIYHMGIKQEIPVYLNLQSLSMHTFITGGMRSGKTNTVSQMLYKLNKKGVHFLVIDPTKGEYKHILSKENMKVYGMNPHVGSLLRINPFKFPLGIHVLEHIEYLVELFNICWMLPAVMTGVLKKVLEKLYEHAGWNLNTSENKCIKLVFPTFKDLLDEFVSTMADEVFPQNDKKDYLNILNMKVEPLTRNLYGSLFDNEELGDEILFENDVIVDLSCMGAVEIKVMIIRTILMRLQEYRKSIGAMNSQLKHVTVLEEAYSLLNKSSRGQDSQYSYWQRSNSEILSSIIEDGGKSGEGFIIVEEAPALIDMRILRSISTTIVLRTLNPEDRERVGQLINLNANQVGELSKLSTGVAVIYQTNWLEPILCKIHHKKRFFVPI